MTQIQNIKDYDQLEAPLATKTPVVSICLSIMPDGIDDFGEPVKDFVIDGKTKQGSWAYMTPKNFWKHGTGIGNGMGQAYYYDGEQWNKTNIVPEK